MRIGMIGLSDSGKSTVFEALTHNFQELQNKADDRIGTVKVPDYRIDILSEMYQRKKTIYAQVEYFLPRNPGEKKEKNLQQALINKIRDCDALIHVVRNFQRYGLDSPSPLKDFATLDQELYFSDLLVIEKRLERLELDQKRGKKPNPEELFLLNECKKNLENELPLRRFPEISGSRLLKGFAFVSAKPMLVLFNNADEDNALPVTNNTYFTETCLVIRGKLEQELAQMSNEEAESFLSEFDINSSAMDRVIKKSYELIGLISFFTIGTDEVRAWTIKSKTSALEAAGVVHSDMQKGFIRAEILPYEDLIKAGSYAEARKKGSVRLEGKTYEVQDGDIITFRFNV